MDFRRITNLATNTVLFLVSLLAAALIAEMLVRTFMPQIFEEPHSKTTFDPKIGRVLIPGHVSYIERSEFKFRFHVNQEGLRGEEVRARQPNSFRVLVLGDSQTFGMGVNDDQTYSKQLEGLLSAYFKDMDIQVLNAGVPAYGTGEQLAFLKTRGPRLVPDLVILQFLSVNDFEDNRSHYREWAAVKEGRMAVSEIYGFHYYTLPWWRKLHAWLKSKSHLAKLISNRVGYLSMKRGFVVSGEDFTEEDARISTEYLVAIAKETRKLNANCLFLYTAGQGPVISDKAPSLRSARLFERVASKADVNWINSVPYLRNHPNKFDLYYPKDGHWTATGHRTIAELLLEEIIKLKFVPEAAKGKISE